MWGATSVHPTNPHHLSSAKSWGPGVSLWQGMRGMPLESPVEAIDDPPDGGDQRQGAHHPHLEEPEQPHEQDDGEGPRDVGGEGVRNPSEDGVGLVDALAEILELLRAGRRLGRDALSRNREDQGPGPHRAETTRLNSKAAWPRRDACDYAPAAPRLDRGAAGSTSVGGSAPAELVPGRALGIGPGRGAAHPRVGDDLPALREVPVRPVSPSAPGHGGEERAKWPEGGEVARERPDRLEATHGAPGPEIE